MKVARKQRVLVLGVTGMLGSSLFRAFRADGSLDTFGTMRSEAGAMHFAPKLRDALIPNVHIESEASILSAFAISKPDVVINCVGLIKQHPHANDYLENLAINAVLPHRLARYSNVVGARLVHFSTDCVFSGKSGQYREGDCPDACDLYGRTKFLGEVDYENAVTLRTSIIGHELASAKSLVDWFLGQSGEIKGYRRAIFSGLPTIELARVVREYVVPNPALRGLYHVSVDPISKYELLRLVAECYERDVAIFADEDVVIDRSLNSDRFKEATGFRPEPWPLLIKAMHDDYRAKSSRMSLSQKPSRHE
ncbi:MAG TPA: SDR family oxidoreductase [Candidatus Saccharibacteria bacterium]|nr:SDR family oxidoreductase [Candidatus Saccharibacteria bacterium]